MKKIIFWFFTLVYSISIQAQCVDVNNKPNDNFSLEAWMPTCAGASDGFIRVTNITGGNPSYTVRLLSGIGGSVIQQYSGITTSSFDIPNLSAGNYTVDIRDQCNNDSADKQITINPANPSFIINYQLISVSGTCTQREYNYSIGISTSSTLQRSFTVVFQNNLGQQQTENYDAGRAASPQSGVGIFITQTLSSSFFNGGSVQVRVTNTCGTQQTLTIPLPSTPSSPFNFTNTQNIQSGCNFGYNILVSSNNFIGPVIANIVETNSSYTTVVNSAPLDILGNPFVQLSTTANGTLYMRLRFNVYYRITLTDACGVSQTYNSYRTLSLPTSTVTASAFSSNNNGLFDTTIRRLSVNFSSTTGLYTPITVSILSGPSEWTSQIIGATGPSSPIGLNYNPPLTFMHNALTTSLTIDNIFLPRGTYVFRIVDNCGNVLMNNQSINLENPINSPNLNITTSFDYCSPNDGLVNITINDTANSNNLNGTSAALLDQSNNIIQITNSVPRRFTNVPTGQTYKILFGGVSPGSNPNAIVQPPLFNTIPRLYGTGYIYEKIVTPLTLSSLDLIVLNNCTSEISVSGVGGLAPYVFNLYNPSTNALISGPNSSGNFTGLTLGTTYRVEMTDSCGRTYSENITVLPQTTLPTIQSIQNVPCANSSGSITLASLPTTPYTINIQPLNLNFNGVTPTYTIPNLPAGNYTISVGSTNTCYSTPINATIALTADTTPPTFVLPLPSNTTVNCNSIPPVANVQATDNSGNPVTITFSETTQTLVCPNFNQITRVWTAVDSCNNTVSHTQIITVQDTTAPVITGTLPVISASGCSVAAAPAAFTTVAQLEAAGLTIADACTADANLTVTSTQTISGSCPFVLTRTYSITDTCGNTTTVTQTINVQDTTAPVITGTLPVISASGCSVAAAPAAFTTVAQLEAAGLAIADACTADANLTVTSTQTISGSCPFVLTRTYSITDTCGNTTTVTQTINVQDTTAPVITGTLPAISASGCSVAAAPAAFTTVAQLEAAGLTIADACTADANLTVTSTQTISGSCPFVLTRTYSITDTCGNTTTVTQTINVQDTTAPVITGTLPVISASGCSVAAAPAAFTTVAQLEAAGLTIADACTADANLTVTSTQTISGSCPFVLTRTYSITDTCGNTTTVTQTINVQDTTAPVITGTLPVISASGCSVAAAPAAFTTVAQLEAAGLAIADACTADANLTVTSTQTISGSCPFVLTRTYSITDTCGNTTTVTQTINVQDTTAPVITGTLPAISASGCSVAAAPAAFTTVAQLEAAGLTIADACTADANLTVTSTQTISGSCPFVLTRTYSITDTCGNTTTVTQTINVQDTTAPVITGTLPAISASGCSVAAAPAAFTTVAQLEAAGLTIADACTADANLTVTSTQTISGSCPFVLTRTYSITDTCGNTTTVTQTINVQDTTAPVITGTLPVISASGCSVAAAPAAFTTVAQLEAAGLTIADACTADANLTVTSTQTISGSCPFVLTRTYSITDTCGNTTTVTQTINVQDTTAPVITGTLPVISASGCSVAAAPAAFTTVAQLEAAGLAIADACTADANLTVTSTQTISGSCPFVLTRTYSITDTCGNTTTVTQTINVQDTTAPVITGTLPAISASGCSVAAAPAAFTTVAQLEAAGLTIADACTADANLTVTSTQTISGSCPFVLTRTYSITDTCGNTTTVTQTINVQDTTAPVITGTLPAISASGCSVAAAPAAFTTVAQLEAAGLTIADACTADANLTVTSTQTISGSCPFVLTRTYSITDTCGNTTTVTQTINVQDTTAPVITGTLPVISASGCSVAAAPAAFTTVAQLEAAGLTIADACTADANLTVTSTQTISGSCPFVLTRTYSITDTCGNTTTVTQTINVQDTTAPVITGTLPVISASGCSVAAAPAAFTTVAQLEAAGLAIADACTADANLTVTSTQTISGSCPFVLTRTYSITDTCGNTTTVTQTINVQDTTAPVITGTLPAISASGCSVAAAPAAFTTVAQLEAAGLTIADACTADANLTVTSTQTISGSCPFVLTRTYSITDTCGNTTTVTQTINVQDTTAPTFVESLPADVTVECNAVPVAAVLTATDNCGTANVTYSEVRTDGTCPNSYSLARTWTATDACGLTTVHTQTITVQDTTAPTFVESLPADVTVECNAVPVAAVLTATDNCGTANVTYSEVRTDGTCPNSYSLARTWTATDACGLTTTQTQTITVQDTTAPTFVESLPADVTVECNAVPVAAVLTATDNCGTANVTYNEVRTDGTCPNSYSLARTWTATDACGLTTVHTQTITVQDTTAPTFVESLPADVTVECNAVPVAAVLAATDNCGTANVTYSEVRTDGTCPNSYSLARTWTATDACGLTTVHTQTITVQDTTAPTFVESLPADVTVECNAVPVAAVLTATDNCGTANVTYNEVRTDGTCPNSYSLARTWTATDACGLTTTQTQTITVQDTTAPTFVESLPADVTVECNAVPVAAVLTATDNCGTANVTYNEVRTDGTCPNSYSLARTWTATDACGLTTVHTQTITVQDTTAPTFVESLPADVTVECNAVPVAAVLAATDNCGTANVTYSEVRTDGTCPNSYSLARTWTATDACGLTTVHTQTITVQDTTAPTFVESLPADVTVECNAVPVAAVLTATDNCGTANVTYNEVRTDGTCPNSYSLARTWTATDACGLTTVHTQTITVQDTTAPTFVESLPADVTVECNAVPVAAVLTATDNCGTANVTYNEVRTDGTCPNSYSLARTWTATDACGLTTVHTQTITVQDTTAPTFVESLPADVTVECNAVPVAAVLTATDNCGTANVTYNEVRTDGTCPNSYSLARTWTATDACGLTTVHTQTITVQDTTAPTFVESLPADVTVECNAVPVAAVLAATDNCGTANVTYSEVRTDGTCPNSYSLARTWTATDACGLTTVHTQTITVQDTTAPTFVESLPADVTVECNAVPVAAVLTATDNCGTANVTYNEVRTDGTCPNSYSLARTWTATDACGLTTVHTQTITVQDTTAPTFVESLPADVTVECNAVPVAAVLTATDNCGTANVTYNEVRTDGTCPNSYSLARTWTATDACGLTTVHTQTITVQDTTAPTFVESLPADVTVECNAVPVAAVLTATDNCGTANVTYSEVRTDGTCPNSYSLARTWTATDACGLTTVHIQTITVQDNTAPTFVESLPVDLVLECTDVVPIAAVLTATDNCGTANVTYNEVRTNGSCPSNYTLTRTWIAKDICGNETNHIQIIDIQDTTPPIFTRDLPVDGFADCDNIPVAPTVTATDNCGNVTITLDERRVDGDCSSKYQLIRTWTASDECGNSSIFEQTLTLACHVKVWNAVSPNSDTKNDIFYLEGIDCYPNNSVEIYNRWGIKVYETSGYDNINKVFSGYSDGRSTISRNELLPTGTYFYILKYEYSYDGVNGKQNIDKSGYLYIQNN